MDEALIAQYPDLEESHFWWAARRELVYQLLEQSRSIDGMRFLDVGCGSGVTDRMLLEGGATGVGVDITDNLEPNLSQLEGFQFRRGDYLELSPYLGQFDVVLALDAVEHFQAESNVLESLFSNTKAGGVAIITVPAYRWLWSSHDDTNQHFRRYTRKRLGHAVKGSGFEVARLGYVFGALLLPKAILSLLEVLGLKISGHGKAPSNLANQAASAYFTAEISLALKLRGLLPFGTSVVCVAEKPTHWPEKPYR